MRSGYVTQLKEYFKGKSVARNIRDLHNQFPKFTIAQLSTALNYLTRTGYLVRFIDNIDGRKPHKNTWHYKKSKDFIRLKALPKKNPVTIRKKGVGNELQEPKTTGDS